MIIFQYLYNIFVNRITQNQLIKRKLILKMYLKSFVLQTISSFQLTKMERSSSLVNIDDSRRGFWNA